MLLQKACMPAHFHSFEGIEGKKKRNVTVLVDYSMSWWQCYPTPSERLGGDVEETQPCVCVFYPAPSEGWESSISK